MTRENAYVAIAAIEGLSLELARATDREIELADARSLEKDAAIRRLMAAGTYTSVTAAEKYVEADPEFMAHRQREREAVAHRIVMQAKLEAATLRGRLAVELCAIDEQSRDLDDENVVTQQSSLLAEHAIDHIGKLLDDAGVEREYGNGLYIDVVGRVRMLIERNKANA